MKRAISLLLAFVISFSIFTYIPFTESPFGVFALAADEYTLTYTFDETAQTYSVTGYTGTLTDLVIPAEYEGYPVAKIAASAFSGCSAVSVTIADTITTVEQQAFYNCTKLKSVTLSANLQTIGAYGFYNCYSLTSIELPDSMVEIGDYAFWSCSKLSSVNIPANVKKIGDCALGGTNLKVYIEDLAAWCGIEFKSSRAFGDSAKIYINDTLVTDLVIPEGVTSISDCAFSRWKSIASVAIPTSVKHIGTNAFNLCENIEKVYINDVAAWCNITFVNGGSNPFYGTNVACEFVVNGQTLSEIVIPEGVTEIKNYAFFGFSKITSFIFPESLTKIGDYAFSNCFLLKAINLPQNVTMVGEFAFSSCSNVESIEFSENLSTIGNRAFNFCEALTSVTLPDGLTTIGEYAFYYCSALEWLYLPGTLQKIGDYAFWNCKNLEEIVFGGCRVDVGINAFYAYGSLEKVTITDLAAWCESSFASSESNPLSYGTINTGEDFYGDLKIPEGTTKIGKYVFLGNSIHTISLPSTVTEIDETAFLNCNNLKSFTVDENNSVFSAVDGVLFNKTKLILVSYPQGSANSSYTIPDGVVTVKKHAFANSTNIDTIIFPHSIKNIAESAYLNCTNIKYIFFKGTQEEWGQVTIGSSNPIASLPVHYGITEHVSSGEWTYSEDFDCNTTKPIYKVIKCEYCNYWFEQIPVETGHKFKDNVCTICDVLEYEYSVTTTAEGTQKLTLNRYNGNKKHVEIPSYIDGNKVVALGSELFYLNSRLESVSVPSTVGGIYDEAFSGCSNLSSVTLSEGLRLISERAFCNCDKLEEIHLPDTVTTISSYAFYSCDMLSKVALSANLEFIEDFTFSECTSLAEVVISGNISAVGDSAFSYCTSLAEVVISGNISAVGDSAFSYCTSLEKVVINGNEATIGDSAFSRCASLKSISFSGGVQAIEANAFNYCTALEEVYVDSINTWCGISFGNYLANPLYYAKNFYIDNKPATDIVIPFGVTAIGAYAFYDYDGLTSISINNSVMEIGQYAFAFCSGLTSVSLPRALLKVEAYAFYNCENLKSVKLPAVLSEIGSYAFYNCASLVEINFPANLKTIGDYSFANCTSLKSWEPAEGVLSIGTGAFNGCTSLEKVVIPDSVIVMEGSSFSDCTALKEVDWGSGRVIIEAGTFSGCTSLETIVVTDTLKEVRSNAFLNCDSLKYIFYGGTSVQWVDVKINATGCDPFKNAKVHYNGIGHIPQAEWTYSEGFDCETSVERYKWKKCEYCDDVVELVEIPQGHVIVDNVCENCGFSDFIYTVSNNEVTIQGYNGELVRFAVPSVINGYPVTSIDASAFSGREDIISVVIPSSVKRIGASAFENCVNLGSITIPDDVVFYYNTFENTAYYNNPDNWIDDFLYIDNYLVRVKETVSGKVTLKEGIATIANGAFTGCEGITAIEMADTIKNYEKGVFAYCTSLKDLVIGESAGSISNAIYGIASLENLEVNTALTELVQTDFASNTVIKTLVIGEGVTTIGANAFKGMKGLVSVQLPESVTSIGNYAFYNCSSLKNVNIPSCVSEISPYMFNGCSSLETVYLPETVTSIGAQAFYNCSMLNSITIPAGVTSLDSKIFYNCTSLANVYIPEGVTAIADYVFYKCAAITEINIPEACTSIGNYAFYGCSGLTEVEIPATVTELGSNVFYGCTNLKKVNIPYGITAVGASLFYNCSSLESIDIPDTVTSIGSSAFRGCEKLESITIPEAVTTIGDYAFRGCALIEELIIPDAVTKLGTNIIGDCTSLKKVVVGDGVTSVGTIFKGQKSIENVVLGAGVKTYLSSAFKDCKNLKYLTLGKNSTATSTGMLSGCTSLRYVVVPPSVASINSTTFTGFTGTVLCWKNSPIHTYAENRSISYILVDVTSNDNGISVEPDVACIFTEETQTTDILSRLSTDPLMSLTAMKNETGAKTGYYGTGSVITHTIEDCIIGEYTIIVSGDLNGDGICDVLDVALTAKYASGKGNASKEVVFAANGQVADTIDVDDYQLMVNKALA